jgi:hypothetical protein
MPLRWAAIVVDVYLSVDKLWICGMRNMLVETLCGQDCIKKLS